MTVRLPKTLPFATRFTTAVILAVGVGTRSAFSRPKQVVKLGGRPVIAHALERFDTPARTDEIAVAANEVRMDRIELIVSRGRPIKVKRLLLGGSGRYSSSRTTDDAARSSEPPRAEYFRRRR